MSDILLPDGEPATSRKSIIGRRLKPAEQLFALFGQLVFLRDMSNAQGIPCLKANGYIGILQCILPDPAYPFRASAIAVMGAALPGNFFHIETAQLERCDPWCHPPGFPEMAVSMLEE